MPAEDQPSDDAVMEAERVKRPTLERQEKRFAAPTTANESRVVQLQSLIGNRALTSLIVQGVGVQRTPLLDDSEPPNLGTLTGLWNVPANLKGRLLKIHLIARYGELSEADATKLVELHNMPTDDMIHRQSNGAVKFFLSARERALIAKERPSMDAKDAKDAKARRKQTPLAPRDRRSVEQAVTTAADVGTDFAPIVGNLKDAYIAMTGENPVTGEKVGIAGRILAGIFALPVMGNVLKYLGKGSKLLVDVGKWIAKTRLGKWIAEKSMRLWKKGELGAGSKAGDEATATGSKARGEADAAKAGDAAADATKTLSPLQRSVAAEAQNILRSKELDDLRTAFSEGKAAEVVIGGRTIIYEPSLSRSGMTLFGEDAFVLGQHAFSSPAELTKTLLHELHRLSTSASKAAGASGALVAEETAAAFDFAEQLHETGAKMGMW